MFWFKRCPRCSGDLYGERDQYGPFISCIQCGFTRDLLCESKGLVIIAARPMPVPAAPQPVDGKRRRISHGGRHFARTIAIRAETAA